MTSLQRIIILCTSITITLILTSCNLPQQSSELPLEDQAGTLAAQTLAALPSATLQPTETRAPANTPTQAPPTLTLTHTLTPTPEVSPTPTEKPAVPAKPTLQKYDFYCTWNGSNNDLSVNIQWVDNANNELGYIILRNGEEINNLIPGATTYDDLFAVDTGVTVKYAIQAYNNYGVSDPANFTVSCQ